MFKVYSHQSKANSKPITQRTERRGLADQRRALGMRDLSQYNFFHFRAFVGQKSCQLIGFCPKPRVCGPPVCEKPIRHCKATTSIDGSKARVTPSRQIFFIFMRFSGNIRPNNRLSGKSWIRHWLDCMYWATF